MYEKKPIRSLFTYPPTWLVLVIIATCQVIFAMLFSPSVVWSTGGVILDIAGFAFWAFFAFKSKSFQEHYNRMPYESRNKEIYQLIRTCPENFRKPAMDAVNLIEQINTEFPDQSYSVELEMMLSNIRELSQNHAILSERARRFGNQEQKKKMDSILSGQMNALESTITTLKTFSGNLTLLAVNEKQTQVATDELKYINQGLKEVIEELDTDN